MNDSESTPTRGRWFVAAAFLLLAAGMARGDEIDFSGSVGIEARAFVDAAALDDQDDRAQFSLFAEPEWGWSDASGTNQAGLTLFGRWDSVDVRRSHVDVREMFWRHVGGDWEVLAGVNRVFWGVTESRHLVNVLNQVDSVENVDEEDYLGQPMIEWTLQKDYGRFSAFYLPYFRERTFPGGDGRLRFPAPIETEDARYGSRQGQWHPDMALRYAHFIGDWDVGVHYFRGTNREPRFEPIGAGPTLRPVYDRMDQVGVDLQYTKDAWLWKAEGLFRHTERDDFTALVAGFEYTFFQKWNRGDGDIGVLAEYLFDDRQTRHGFPTAFQNDLFLGSRLSWNDIQDTAALAGVALDIDDGSTSARLEFERRFGNAWKLELQAQIFAHANDDNLLDVFRRDSFLTLSLARYF